MASESELRGGKSSVILPELAFVYLLGAATCFYAAHLVDPLLLHRGLDDIWFESDMARSFRPMLDRHASGVFPAKHPVFALFAWLAMAPIRATGLSDIESLRLLLSLNGGLFCALLVYILQLGHVRPLSRYAVVAVAISSSAFWLWFTVPDKFGFAATTVLIGLLPAALDRPGKRFAWKTWIVCTAVAGAVTITHIAVPAAALLVRLLTRIRGEGEVASNLFHEVRRACIVLIAGASLVAIGSLVQNTVFPGSGLALSPNALAREPNFLFRYEVSSFSARLQTLIVQPGVVGRPYKDGPTSRMIDSVDGELAGRMKVDGVFPSDVSGALAAISWLLLLGAGMIAIVAAPARSVVATTAGLMFLAQLGLHLVYGEQSFLYVAHLLPCMLIVMAAAQKMIGRPLFVILCTVFGFSGVVNSYNGLQATNALAVTMAHELLDQAGAPQAPASLKAAVFGSDKGHEVQESP